MDWQERARCKDLTPEESDKMFFLKRGGSANKAEQFCSKCPVQQECGNHSILYDERGIWAGMTDEERVVISPYLKPVLLLQAIQDHTLKVFFQPSARPESLSRPTRCLHCGANHGGICPNTLPPTNNWLQIDVSIDDSVFLEIDLDSQYIEQQNQLPDEHRQVG